MSFEGDARIVEITRQLCQQLNVTDYNPTSVAWKTEVLRGKTRFGPVYSVLPWDQCLLGDKESDLIILPEYMRDKLEPEDWRPIIASALFYKKKLRSRIITGVAIRALLPIGIVAALFIAFPIILSTPTLVTEKTGYQYVTPLGRTIWFSLIPLWFTLITLTTTFLGIIYRKKMRLLADRDAADILGTPLFLDVLNKISVLDTNDLGKTKNRKTGRDGAGVTAIPTLQERILDLQNRLGQGPVITS